MEKSLFFPQDQLPGAGAGIAISALARVSLGQSRMGYTVCTEWGHFCWIPLDFFVSSEKRHANWAPVFQAYTWRIHY